MSKYIDKDKVLEYIIFGVVGKDITCGELTRAIESLPTIEVSEDCISKAYLEQEIENQTMTVNKDEEYWLGWNNALGKVVELIEDSPSVTTEQSSIVGEWKPFDRTWGREIWACSACEESVANMPTSGDKPLYDYCPNCGAKMKGAEE